MTTPIKDALQDIAKNVISTGFFEKIKITADSKGTTIEALEKDKNVILKAKTLKAVAGWEGDFGLANLGLLGSIVNDSDFSHKDSVVELITQQRKGVDVPVELSYKNKSKSVLNYRFIAPELCQDQPRYTEPKWDVTIVPTKAAIQQFGWAAGALSGYETFFYPKTVDGNLVFFIGEDGSASQRGGVTFAENIKGEFESNHKWPISQVLQILKLASSSECQFKISTKGALQIDIATGVGEYSFVFPAKMR